MDLAVTSYLSHVKNSWLSLIWKIRAYVSAPCACLSCSLAFLLLYVVFLSKYMMMMMMIPCARLRWLPVRCLLHVNTHYRIVSYRIVCVRLPLPVCRDRGRVMSVPTLSVWRHSVDATAMRRRVAEWRHSATDWPTNTENTSTNVWLCTVGSIGDKHRPVTSVTHPNLMTSLIHFDPIWPMTYYTYSLSAVTDE